jgi:hypothetical protein
LKSPKGFDWNLLSYHKRDLWGRTRTPLSLHLIFEPLKVFFDSRLFPPEAKDIKEKNDPNGAVSGKKIA